MKKIKYSHSPTAESFWNAFRACVEENRVGPDRSRHPVAAIEEKTLATEGTSGSMTFSDRVIPGEDERLYPFLLESMKAAIHSRHYSIRTETVYVDWARRYIACQGPRISPTTGATFYSPLLPVWVIRY